MPGVDYDEDEFGDFLSKIEDVNKLVSGLKDGTVDPKDLDKPSKYECDSSSFNGWYEALRGSLMAKKKQI